MTILITMLLAALGLVMGSFAGAQVWRLRARQLMQDKAAGEEYDKAEYKRLKPLTGQKTTEDRSRCLSCGHTLAGRDLVPLFSWLSTKGRCRYCKKPIGRFEPLMEFGAAMLFGVFGYVWITGFGLSPVGILLLVLWLVALTMFIILFAYDLKWFLLPDIIMFPLIGLSIIITTVTIISTVGVNAGTLLSTIVSIGILGGLYLLLWTVSRGMWVGFGDVKLGVALGILLIDWKLALLTLFLANLIGTLVVLPGLLTGKLSRKAQVPFGPFLIIGFLISVLAGQGILAAYDAFNLWLSATMLML